MKVLICSALSHGHLNMSLRIGRELQSRGHEVAAVCNSMYEPVIRNNGLQPIVFQEPTSSKLGNDLHVTCLANSFQKPKSLRVGDEAEVLKHVCLYQQTMDSEYARLFEEYAPDIILQDHIIPCPAVIKSGRPWVRLLSCNPLYLDVADLPPAITAARTDAGRMQLNVERAKRNNLLQPVHKLLQQWMCDHDLPAIDFFSHFYSPNLNFYIYPKEVDYFDEESVKMPGNWHQLDFCTREQSDSCEIPQWLLQLPGKLVYFSIGTMACSNIAVMQRMLDILSKSPNKFIISKGHRGNDLKLHSNQWGQPFLPQTAVLKQVDLAITHGGNNTFTECFFYGVPMIVMPFFGDQLDNATRLVELGMGLELDAIHCTECELLTAIQQMLDNESLTRRYRQIAERIQTNGRSASYAADLIEQYISKPKVGSQIMSEP